jgi:hypothetical protein
MVTTNIIISRWSHPITTQPLVIIIVNKCLPMVTIRYKAKKAMENN